MIKPITTSLDKFIIVDGKSYEIGIYTNRPGKSTYMRMYLNHLCGHIYNPEEKIVFTYTTPEGTVHHDIDLDTFRVNHKLINEYTESEMYSSQREKFVISNYKSVQRIYSTEYYCTIKDKVLSIVKYKGIDNPPYNIEWIKFLFRNHFIIHIAISSTDKDVLNLVCNLGYAISIVE